MADHTWKLPPTDTITTDMIKPPPTDKISVETLVDDPVNHTEASTPIPVVEAFTDAELETLTAPAANTGDTMERLNAGKLKLGLIPPSLNYYLGKVLMYGALKYAEHNWRKGGSWVENSESLQRHLDLWKEGEDCDAESGLPHLAHIAFNTMALIEFYDKGLGSDDRFRYPSQPADQRRPGRTLSFRQPPRRQ